MNFTSCLLVILALSFSAKAQSQKGNWVINPQITVSQWKFASDPYRSYQTYAVGTTVQYFFTDKLAVGIWFDGYYYNYKAKTIATFTHWRYQVSLIPEVHYSLLTTRFSPFIRVGVGLVGYTKQHYDNPNIPEQQRGFGNWIFNAPIYRPSLAFGFSYSIREKFGLTTQVKLYPLQPDNFSNSTIGFGCQFVL